jgi:hypothetical protein
MGFFIDALLTLHDFSRSRMQTIHCSTFHQADAKPIYFRPYYIVYPNGVIIPPTTEDPSDTNSVHFQPFATPETVTIPHTHEDPPDTEQFPQVLPHHLRRRNPYTTNLSRRSLE